MKSVSGKTDPVVRRIAVADIVEALSEGLRDFQAVPLYGVVFGALYAAGGIAIMLCLLRLGLVYLAYPLAAGFAMIGPFVATGLYDVSRRRENGLTISDAVRLFLRQVVMTRGLPFDVRVPNETTVRALRESDEMSGRTRRRSPKELFDELDQKG